MTCIFGMIDIDMVLLNDGCRMSAQFFTSMLEPYALFMFVSRFVCFLSMLTLPT